eukprot:m.352178 g.352178  ORF g.352178 m.352178 type:complete len:68 (+) comp16460_c0_seq1:1742-1945(+)
MGLHGATNLFQARSQRHRHHNVRILDQKSVQAMDLLYIYRQQFVLVLSHESSGIVVVVAVVIYDVSS